MQCRRKFKLNIKLFSNTILTIDSFETHCIPQIWLVRSLSQRQQSCNKCNIVYASIPALADIRRGPEGYPVSRLRHFSIFYSYLPILFMSSILLGGNRPSFDVFVYCCCIGIGFVGLKLFSLQNAWFLVLVYHLVLMQIYI